ncbi:hypothetical protein JB92DRAFT_2193266 [Gautieria morchelliformis]|nr:hypothetical protein JB92DRAFT_2193266 [Gautieria morchelliformis]
MRTGIENTSQFQGGAQDHDEGSGPRQTPLLLPIRVLYTINASPQFLLARQRRKVHVVPVASRKESTEAWPPPVPAGNTNGWQRFAKVPLRTCLGAVCTSSPELLADRSHDYSVYVLDPLESTSTEDSHAASDSESLADTRLSNPSPSSCLLREGVSIGMGLMSWCISDDRVVVPGIDDDDDGCVVGKLVKDRGADALEVVISLRETTVQSQQQHALSLSSFGFYPTPTASPSNCSSQANARHSLIMPSSPKAHSLSGFPESSQSSIGSVDLYRESVAEGGETSTPEAASSGPTAR